MKIINSIYRLTKSSLVKEDLSLTIGVFDGLHIGHEKLIESTLECAKTNKTKSAVLTFNNHPLQLLAPAYSPQPLLSNEEKINLLKQSGIDYIIMIPFDKNLSNLTPEKFIESFLLKYIKIKCIIVGYDFRFGKDAQGDLSTLRRLSSEYNFKVKAIEPVNLYGRIVSSTEIRELLLDGKISLANCMLAREYSITGTVEKGDKRGRILGFPTANLRVKDNKLLPKCGVYLARVQLNNKKMFGMLYIGTIPTFGNKALSVELHIFNLNDYIYGQKIKISFIKRLRNEKKFGNSEELRTQLIKDKNKSLNLLKKIKII